MIGLEAVLEQLRPELDRAGLEHYIALAWIRPVVREERAYFEEIDVARARLITQLRRDMLVNDEAMEVVLHLLDQLYSLRERMRGVSYAISRQPEEVRGELATLLAEIEG